MVNVGRHDTFMDVCEALLYAVNIIVALNRYVKVDGLQKLMARRSQQTSSEFLPIPTS